MAANHAPRLLAALTAALELLEEWAVRIDSEWGSCRDLSELEADGDLPSEVLEARAAIAEAAGGS